jgi:hypothetical protein
MRTFVQKQNQPQQKLSANLTSSNAPAPVSGLEAHPLLHLQRTVGNQAVLQLLKAGSNGLEAGPRTAPQAKLTVSTPGDSYELEADQIAEQVMRMPEPQLQRACACSGGCPSCQTQQSSQAHEHLQTKPAGASASGQTTASPLVNDVLGSSGQPLDTATRAFMEPRFGYDFSAVRVHSGAVAEQSAREVNANAYTVGHNIVFAAGRFTPQTHEGQRLIAHELTHVVQQSGSNGSHTLAAPVGISRQSAGTMTDDDKRKFVRDTTEYFTQAAKQYEISEVDAARFERVINTWYELLANQEALIKELGGDSTLTFDLRAAYTDAIRALMKRAALKLKRPETDLYRENSGRIPVWAWLQPHHMEPNISTPIPEGRSSDAFNEVAFKVNGWDVTIKPDAHDPSLSGAKTHLDLNPGSISTPQRDANGRVSSFTVPTPKVTIQTIYGQGTTAASNSGYGRGTTPADVAGGRVTPHSISLGFHEGHHGLDYVEFLQSNPPPAFTGAQGDTIAEFNNKIRAWNAAWTTFNANADSFTTGRTECVGTTIDQFHQAQGGGARVTLICRP